MSLASRQGQVEQGPSSELFSHFVLVDLFAHYLQNALDLPRLSFAMRAGEGSSVASNLREVIILVYAVASHAVGVVGSHLERIGDLVVRLLVRPSLIRPLNIFMRWMDRTRESNASVSLHHLNLWVKHGRGCGARVDKLPAFSLACLHHVDHARQVGILSGERTTGLL